MRTGSQVSSYAGASMSYNPLSFGMVVPKDHPKLPQVSEAAPSLLYGTSTTVPGPCRPVTNQRRVKSRPLISAGRSTPRTARMVGAISRNEPPARASR